MKIQHVVFVSYLKLKANLKSMFWADFWPLLAQNNKIFP